MYDYLTDSKAAAISKVKMAVEETEKARKELLLGSHGLTALFYGAGQRPVGSSPVLKSINYIIIKFRNGVSETHTQKNEENLRIQ